MNDDEKMKIVFAPGCFDTFDGSQEELDELLAEISRMMESGEFWENSRVLTDEEIAELPDDIRDSLIQALVLDERLKVKNVYLPKI